MSKQGKKHAGRDEARSKAKPVSTEQVRADPSPGTPPQALGDLGGASAKAQRGSREKDLRLLNEREVQEAYDRAHAAKKLHGPSDLREAWARRRRLIGAAGVADLVRVLREGAKSPEMKDPTTAPAYVARLIEIAVRQFERLLVAGVFNDVLPRLTALPLLYSLKAGKGAPEWTWARRLFEKDDSIGKKAVGSDAAFMHVSPDPKAERNQDWSFLATEAIDTVRNARLSMQVYCELRARAIAFGTKVARAQRGKYFWASKLYLLDDGGALVWPNWLDHCVQLPPNVRDNVSAYKDVCRTMLNGFFGDPGNGASRELIQGMMDSDVGNTPSRARKEAIRMVLGRIESLGDY